MFSSTANQALYKATHTILDYLPVLRTAKYILAIDQAYINIPCGCSCLHATGPLPWHIRYRFGRSSTHTTL